MGQEIVYCHECQSRLIGSEFEKGKAFRIQNQNYCLPCAQKLLNSLPPHERDAFAALMTQKEPKKSTQRIPIVQEPRPPSVRTHESGRNIPFRPDSTNARMVALQPKKKGSPLPWIGLGIGALAVVGLLVAVASGGGGRSTAPPTTTSPAPPTPAFDPRAAEAKRLFEAAKTYAAAHPEDTIGQIDRFSKAAWHAPNSAVAQAAQAEIEAVRARSRARQQQELAELDRQVMALTAKKDFDGAARLLDAAKGRRIDNDWALAIKRRREQVAALEASTRAPDAPAPPPPAAEPPIVVYDDRLQNGWLDHTWGSEIDFGFTGQRVEGSASIAWTPKSHAAGWYVGPPGPFPLQGLTALSFALHRVEQDLPLQIQIWTDESRDGRLDLANYGLPPIGGWKRYVIPLSDFNLCGRQVVGIVIQSFRHENRGPVAYIDDVAFLRGAPPAPPPAADGAWTPLEAVEARSIAGATLTAQPDGVVAVSGAVPLKDTYVLRLKSPLKAVHAIRLDALAHPSLPGGGPGRSENNGNFVLTEMRVEAAGKPVVFQDVVADFSQHDWAVEGAFDGHPGTGWAIHPACGQNHHLVVRLKEPVDGADLRVTLEQESPHHRHVLGRFRLSATDVRPPDPPPGTPSLASPGLLAYRKGWYAAALHAAARDFPAAIRALEAVDKDGGDEGAADLADLRRAAKLHQEALDVLAKWPVGWNLAGEVVMPDGTRRRFDEPVRRVKGTYVTIRDAGNLPGFEANVLTAASLADLVLARRAAPDDVRAAGLLCAYEGDLEAARKHLGAVPAKLAAHARSLPPTDDPEEVDARRRLLEAEVLYADRSRRADAVESLEALLKDRSGTLLVRRCVAGLRARAESPLEFFFGPGELERAGAFSAQRHAKGEIAWTLAMDVTPRAQRVDHHVEALYSARPGTALRGWVLAGGCCAETFTFGVLATDLPPAAGDDPAVDVVPGSIPFLRKTHALHGGGPKQPSRFEWIALPDLKHAEGGVKRLKIASDQEGFSVAAVVLSAARTKPPADSETRELLAGRALPESGETVKTGTILCEVWENAGGNDMAALRRALGNPPTKADPVKSFQGRRNWADNYGTRIRGYVHPPETGDYVFYLVTDDDGELWLSSDDAPEKKQRIAYQNGSAGYDSWEEKKSMTSAPIPLRKGRRYYIEALQKEGGGEDHVRVGWKLPDGTLERPIPGRRLSPWDPFRTRRWPVVVAPDEPPAEGAAVLLTVDPAVVTPSRVEVYQGATRLGEARGNPPTFTWSNVPAGTHALWARLQERSGRIHTTPITPMAVGQMHLARAVDFNGTGGTLDGHPWAAGTSAVVAGQGYERLDVELRPAPLAERARMIRSSVAARDGTQAVAGGLLPGKYLVYLTLWEPEGPPATVDLLVNGKVVAAGHRFAAAGDWARLGPWPAEPVDGRVTVSAARGTAHFSGLEIWGLGARPTPTRRVPTPFVGSSGGAAFEDASPDGALLTGIRLSQLDGIASSVRPIWGDVRGDHRGTSGSKGVDLIAREGYAVGAVEVHAPRYVEAVRIVFFRVQGGLLNPGDRYESDWYPAAPPAGATKVLGGDGFPVIGLAGRAGKFVDALGLIQLK